MKHLPLFLVALSLGACGIAKDPVASSLAFDDQTNSTVVARFVDDKTPVDGAKNVITLSLNENGRYDLVQTIGVASRIKGGYSEETIELLAGAQCTYAGDNIADGLEGLSCVVDGRIADAPRVEILFERDNNKFTATKITTLAGRGNSSIEPQAKVIGRGMKYERL